MITNIYFCLDFGCHCIVVGSNLWHCEKRPSSYVRSTMIDFGAYFFCIINNNIMYLPTTKYQTSSLFTKNIINTIFTFCKCWNLYLLIQYNRL